MTAPVPVPDPAPAGEPTLGALLLGLSRRTSDAQAAIACGVGILLAAGTLVVAPAWWRLSLVGVSVAAFGGWVVLERGGSAGRWRPLLQGTVLVLGAAAAFALALSLLTRALGIWIS